LPGTAVIVDQSLCIHGTKDKLEMVYRRRGEGNLKVRSPASEAALPIQK
jgi:hypothetical protein